MSNEPLQDEEDELLAKALIKYQDPIKAYLQVYPDQSNKQIADAFMKGKLKDGLFRARITELLNLQGLHLPYANTKLKELLEFKRPVLTKDGVEMYPDGQVQAQALEKLYKLHRLLQPTGQQTTKIDARQVNIGVSEEFKRRLDHTLTQLSSLYQRLKQDKDQQTGETTDAEVV